MNTKTLFVVATLILVASCKKDKSDLSAGTASALKNGVQWNPEISIGAGERHGTFSLRFERSADGFLRERMGIANIPKLAGQNPIYMRYFTTIDSSRVVGHYTSLTDDGDVICDRYNVVEQDTASNYVRVDSYQQSTGKVSGKFSIKLVVRLPKCNPNAPDTLTISNGVFETTLID